MIPRNQLLCEPVNDRDFSATGVVELPVTLALLGISLLSYSRHKFFQAAHDVLDDMKVGAVSQQDHVIKQAPFKDDQHKDLPHVLLVNIPILLFV